MTFQNKFILNKFAGKRFTSLFKQCRIGVYEEPFSS